MDSDWQNQIYELKDRFFHMLKKQKLTDCCFVFGDSTERKIHAHKLILSQASPVFERMFYGLMAEKDEPIVITDITPEIFQAMLNYIYTNSINITTSELACQLYYAAKKYQLIRLMEQCTNYLSKNLKPQNVCQIYEFAEFYEKKTLMDLSLKFIVDHTNQVLVDPNFSDIKISTLMIILDQDRLNINSELVLFNTLERIAIKKGHDVLKEAVKKIRFMNMTPEEFAKGPAHSKLLKEREALDIIIKLNLISDVKYKLPEGFSTNSRQMYRNGYTIRYT